MRFDQFSKIGREKKLVKRARPSAKIGSVGMYTLVIGYREFVFQHAETCHGGTGFYLKDNLIFNERNDLAFNSPGDFDT